MNGFLTEPIILSGEQSIDFINSLQRPDKEYIARRDKIFSKMNDDISIHQNGMDFEVEIANLDLSFIDEMDNEKENKLNSNIDIDSEYNVKDDKIDLVREIFKKICIAKSANENSVIFADTDYLNRIVERSCMYSGSSMNDSKGYVIGKSRVDMSMAGKKEQQQMAKAS